MKPKGIENSKDKGQDIMMTLLNNSSESEPDLLDLPPLKGKKSRPYKKKNNYSPPRDHSVCSLWTFLKILTVLLLFAAVCILSLIAFWLSGQLTDLKHHLENVESQSQGSYEDYQKLQSQIQNVNKTVQGFKTGNHGLDQVVKNLSSVSEKIAGLMAVADTLKQGLKEAPELKQIPITVQTLSNTVASLGSDVASIKTTVDDLTQFRKTTTGQLTEMMEKLVVKTTEAPDSADQSEGGREQGKEGSAETRQKLENLSQMFEKLNTTLNAGISQMNTRIQEHQLLLTVLRNATSSVQQDVTALHTVYATLSNGTEQSSPSSADLREQIQDIVQEMVVQLNADHGDADRTDQKDLDYILKKVDNFTRLLTDLKQQITEIKQDHSSLKGSDMVKVVDNSSDQFVTQAEFQNYKNSTIATMKQMDMTMRHVDNNVDDLSRTFTSAHNQLVNVSTRLDGLQNYLGTLGYHSNKSLSEETTPSSTVSSSTKSPDVTTTTAYQIIHIPEIKNDQALDLNFRRWDRHGNGEVDIKDLPDFLGPNAPDPQEMKKFDLDGNGKYSLEEFEVALGYKPMLSDKEKQPEEKEKELEEGKIDYENKEEENDVPDLENSPNKELHTG